MLGLTMLPETFDSALATGAACSASSGQVAWPGLPAHIPLSPEPSRCLCVHSACLQRGGLFRRKPFVAVCGNWLGVHQGRAAACRKLTCASCPALLRHLAW